MARYDDGYEYEDYGAPGGGDKSLKGYKIIVVVLAVILVSLSGLLLYKLHQERVDFAIEREELVGEYTTLSNDYAGLRSTNDSLNASIVVERMRADSILQALARERNATRAKLRSYEKELGTMRAIMNSYLYTIDSLGKVNSRLASENLGMRSEIKSERLRAEAAEERAADADIKIRQGARVMARDITLALLNNADREVTRVARAHRMRVDFTLSANALADPGTRGVYVRIVGPDGNLLPSGGGQTFEFEGETVVYSAMREVDYQNEDLPIGIFYTPGDLKGGAYTVYVYMDGLQTGVAEILLR